MTILLLNDIRVIEIIYVEKNAYQDEEANPHPLVSSLSLITRSNSKNL